MSIYIKTHIVQKGETLQDIVSKYDVPSVEILQYFHNQNAAKNMNHLGSPVMLGQVLFIPSKMDIQRILSERKEKIARQYASLKNQVLKPDIYTIKQNYRVKIKCSSSINSDNTEQLEFDAQIRYLGETDDGLPILSYKKGNYLINNEVPESKLHDLALSAVDFLYPLEFYLHSGTFKPYKIANIKKITARWRDKKEQLSKNYEDSYSSTYIETMDEAFDEGLSKYFMNDFFIQFLFAPYMEFVDGKATAERKFHTYRIVYQDMLELEIFEDFVQVTQNAYCIDPRTAQQILAKLHPDEDIEENNDQLVESEILGNYQLNKNNRTLQKADIKITTEFYDVKEVIEIEIDLIH